MINSQNNKRVFLTVIFVAILTIIVIGTSFAFFNYTRTGSANTVRTGRINFTSSQDGRINLTNIFPIDPTETGVMNDATKVGTVAITVTGDTSYDKGVEYLISATNVSNTVGTKNIPISISAETSGTFGTSDPDYFENRDTSTNHIYKVLAKDTINNDNQLMVGYIAKNTTGINGTITIKAYIDKNNILISDTYPEGSTTINGVTYYNGTPTTNKTVFTTEEWNSLSSNGVSFQIKVEANEGIWVEGPLTASKYLMRNIASQSSCTITSPNKSSFYGKIDADVVYYTGNDESCLKNYVWYSGKLWRIVAIYPNGMMKLVTENNMTSIFYGENLNFDNSYVDQWLSQEFLPTLYNYQDIVVQNSEWNDSINNNGSIDPYLISDFSSVTKTVGLINSFEYSKSGFDSGYLNIGQFWWLMNPYSASSMSFVRYTGSIYDQDLDSSSELATRGVRPTILLKPGVLFDIENYDGTRLSPFHIMGDIDIGKTNELINTRISGEYIRYNNQLYRIVSIENNITKIVKTDYIYNWLISGNSNFMSNYGEDVFFNTKSNDMKYWDKFLIDSGWQGTTNNDFLTNGTYYMGYYPSNSNYKSTICSVVDTNTSTTECEKISGLNKTYTGLIGLLRAGEMMSANQSTVSHIDSISNSNNLYLGMWLITPKSSDNNYIRSVNDDGSIYYNLNPSSDLRGVRPTLHLKSIVKITGGSGFINDPYEISI